MRITGLCVTVCIRALLMSFLLLMITTASIAESEELTAKEILDRVDDLYRGESSKGILTMVITTEHWTRELKLEHWSKGKDQSLFRILSPKKEKGTATLKSGDDIWNYLPKVNRTIKLPSSMMSQSWMGSHFTNDDLVKESRMTEDYDFEITNEDIVDGVDIIDITCIPKPDAPVVWGKVVARVDRENYLPLEMKYYDEDMEIVRTMTFTEIMEISDRIIPTIATVLPADKPEESTVIVYDEIEFDVKLNDDFFSLRNLQK